MRLDRWVVGRSLGRLASRSGISWNSYRFVLRQVIDFLYRVDGIINESNLASPGQYSDGWLVVRWVSRLVGHPIKSSLICFPTSYRSYSESMLISEFYLAGPGQHSVSLADGFRQSLCGLWGPAEHRDSEKRCHVCWNSVACSCQLRKDKRLVIPAIVMLPLIMTEVWSCSSRKSSC